MTNLPQNNEKQGVYVLCMSRQPPDRTIIATKKEAVDLQQLLEGEYLDFMRKQIRSCDGGFA